MEDNQFGRMLRQQRVVLSFSQKYIASEIGVSAQYLSRVEDGSRSPLSIERISKLKRFGFNIVELVRVKIRQTGGVHISIKTVDIDSLCEFIEDYI